MRLPRWLRSRRCTGSASPAFVDQAEHLTVVEVDQPLSHSATFLSSGRCLVQGRSIADRIEGPELACTVQRFWISLQSVARLHE